MATNIWAKFQGFFTTDRAITVVTVNTVNANGTSLVETPEGAKYIVIGATVTAGARALVQQGRIIGQASNLPTYNVTVN